MVNKMVNRLGFLSGITMTGILLFGLQMVTAGENPSGALFVKVNQGTIQFFPGGDKNRAVEVTDRQDLKTGDSLAAMAETRAVVQYPDQTRLQLKPEARITILPNGIEVKKGKVHFQVTKRGSEFKVTTPSMILGIRGTVFDVTFVPRGLASRVRVFEGLVAVQGAELFDSREVLLGKGESYKIKAGGPGKKERFKESEFKFDWPARDWRSGQEPKPEPRNTGSRTTGNTTGINKQDAIDQDEVVDY